MAPALLVFHLQDDPIPQDTSFVESFLQRAIEPAVITTLTLKEPSGGYGSERLYDRFKDHFLHGFYPPPQRDRL
jgi:hypothetical protein